MPRRKKSVEKAATKKSNDIPLENNAPNVQTENRSKSLQRKIFIVVLALALIGVYLYFRTNIINVAMVNGMPVTRWELEKELNSKYADQTIDTLVNEKIILLEAQKKGVSVNQKEVDERMSEIEKRLEGQISLDEALKAQGLNRESFRKQIEIQLTIDKMFGKEATVSDSEVTEYMEQNQEMMENSTDTASLRNDIKEMLKQQKIGELFDAWFTEIREKVNVIKL